MKKPKTDPKINVPNFSGTNGVWELGLVEVMPGELPPGQWNVIWSPDKEKTDDGKYAMIAMISPQSGFNEEDFNNAETMIQAGIIRQMISCSLLELFRLFTALVYEIKGDAENHTIELDSNILDAARSVLQKRGPVRHNLFTTLATQEKVLESLQPFWDLIHQVRQLDESHTEIHQSAKICEAIKGQLTSLIMAENAKYDQN